MNQIAEAVLCNMSAAAARNYNYRAFQWPPRLPASLLEEDRSVAVVRPRGTPPFAATPSFPPPRPPGGPRFQASHSEAPSPGGGERSTLTCGAPPPPAPLLPPGDGAGAAAKPMGIRAPWYSNPSRSSPPSSRCRSARDCRQGGRAGGAWWVERKGTAGPKVAF